ncbi:MAG: L-threonine 3-dehydrogenase [Candidatus Diapherotrites archaeon]|nr:L-threonine 3-dehydrogenase [Candidatus Diapherotrites archaeon]
MKALFKSKSQRGLELLDVEKPSPKKGEVLVKVKAASICGTDLHIYEWNEWAQNRIKPPLIAGHEVAGEIVELGEGVKGFGKGDLVSAETHVYCGKCFQCLSGNRHVCETMKIFGVDIDGVFAEYAVIPAQNAWKNPKGMKPEIAAIQEPFGNAVHSVFAGGDRIDGSTVLITGAGPIGCFAAGIAKAAGAKKVIVSDLNDFRLSLAGKMKADILVNAQNENLAECVKKETNGRGADIFIEMSGSGAALNDGLKSLRVGGRVSILGVFNKPVALDVTNDIVFKYARIFGINGRLIFDTWKKTSELINKKLVDPSPVITHRFPLKDFEEGFSLLEHGKAGKVVLVP